MTHSHICSHCRRLRVCTQEVTVALGPMTVVVAPCREYLAEYRHEWVCSECKRAAEPLDKTLEQWFDRIEAARAR